VRTALADLGETKCFEDCHDLTWLQDRDSSHDQGIVTVCVPTN
jgi:hypothetical protein